MREFKKILTFLENKQTIHIQFNPFLTGVCDKCHNTIIKIDQDFNDLLKLKLKYKEKNGNGIYIFALVLIGFAGLTSILPTEINDDNYEIPSIYNAQKLVEEGEFIKARITLNEILIKHPNYSTANELMGFVYLQENQLKKASQFYRKALPYSNNPHKVDTALQLIKQKENNNYKN